MRISRGQNLKKGYRTFFFLQSLKTIYIGWTENAKVLSHMLRHFTCYSFAFLNFQQCAYRRFSHCIDQAGLGAFTAKSGRKHYNPPPLTVMWMNFDSPNFPSFCSLSAIISFQTCSNKCILYVLSFHKCIKIKYKMVNMYGVFRD